MVVFTGPSMASAVGIILTLGSKFVTRSSAPRTKAASEDTSASVELVANAKTKNPPLTMKRTVPTGLEVLVLDCQTLALYSSARSMG